MRKGVLVVVMCERTRNVLVRVMLHGTHCAVRMGEEGVSRGSWRLGVVRRTKARMSCPWRLIMDLAWVGECGVFVGNARGLLRIVHRIGGESRHSERRKRRRTRKKRRERL